MHLSRLGAEIVLWSSHEFGFCEPPDSFASGSSIMPQKKNPDAAELLRGKAPRVAASLASLLGTLHALPLAYSKDLQEDKEPAVRRDRQPRALPGGRHRHARGISFNRERLAAAAKDEMLAATDLADALVQRGRPLPGGARPGRWPGQGRASSPAGRSPSWTTSELDGVPRDARQGFAERSSRGRRSSRRSRPEGPRPAGVRAARAGARGAQRRCAREPRTSSTAPCTRWRAT